MRGSRSSLVLIISDIIMVSISMTLAYFTYHSLFSPDENMISYELIDYILFYPLYFVVLILLMYEGIYNHRYDFWNESRAILKGMMLGFIIMLAYLTVTEHIQHFSQIIIGISFAYMAFLMPLSKNILKKKLYKMGIWQRKVKVYANDPFLKTEIFRNHYLGYIETDDLEEAKTVFINSRNHTLEEMKEIIQKELSCSQEVLFIPLMDDYDLTHSHIYQLANTRTNLVVFKNRLKSPYRIFLKRLSDMVMAVIALPLLLPLLAYIAYRIKKEEPNGSIFFNQERLGENGKVFVCHKFRTMYENGDEVLAEYLKEHPEEVEHYQKYHKYQNDPRITSIGDTLRRTSLDEVPQLFNVFKRDMSFIGPRPYMLNEKDKIGQDISTVLSVRPGITGLWQVSGRSDVDFHSRVKLDVWYIQNWNLWMDLVILLKTVKTVFIREGAS